jgi:molybdopterin synthase catalytic subunit
VRLHHRLHLAHQRREVGHAAAGRSRAEGREHLLERRAPEGVVRVVVRAVAGVVRHAPNLLGEVNATVWRPLVGRPRSRRLAGVTDPAPVVRLVDIRETPLDVHEVLAALADESAGGLALFVGTVRDHDRGKSVGGLEYSAHPSALERLREVCENVATKYDVRALAAVHRIGTLALGDAAVVVATAADHRGQAFEASRALIDDLKATVPIWKHQVFADGTDEWVGTP